MCLILGFNVLGIAYDGEEAISKFKSFSTKPDIILLDRLMAKKDGIETTREIMKLSHHPKIIITCTDAYNYNRIKQQALAEGAVSVVIQPITPDDIKREIETVCNLAIKENW